MGHDSVRHGAGEHQFATDCIHAGQRPDPTTGAIMTPVYLTSTFVQNSPGVFRDGYDYARSKNPTRTALESNLAALEGGTHAMAFSSGLAAMDCVLHQLRVGDHVVLSDDVYGGTYRQLDKVFRHLGIETTRVDMLRHDMVQAAMRPQTRLVWLETPSNPMLKVIDIAAIRAIVDQAAASSAPPAGVRDPGLGPLGTPIQTPLLLVDNTFASPALQHPLELGAHVVMHSCTKYIGGHSDLVAGALVTASPELAERLRFTQNAVGAVPSAMDCFLMLRSTKTLDVRMQRHCENAMAIAQWLEAHPSIERVIYPGLASHPQHELATRQMRGTWGPAYGGMISCVVRGGLEKSRRVLERVRIFSLAESLGGVESLIEHPAIMTHASVPAEARAALGIADGLIRLSVGIEHVSDLIKDLESALG
ncbi:MAG: Cystathionine beta-lyase [Phycisphaerales bacterium]|nr:Cystathionine beta-lyase [Phycisphaerales bacterium]MCK6478476.1 cystathionine gamma-synthase [Phycisphaerales bacterium]